MDVLSLLEDPATRRECEESPAYWLGTIGYAAARAAGHWQADPEWELGLLKQAVLKYVQSPACPDETRVALTKEMR